MGWQHTRVVLPRNSSVEGCYLLKLILGARRGHNYSHTFGITLGCHMESTNAHHNITQPNPIMPSKRPCRVFSNMCALHKIPKPYDICITCQVEKDITSQHGSSMSTKPRLPWHVTTLWYRPRLCSYYAISGQEIPPSASSCPIAGELTNVWNISFLRVVSFVLCPPGNNRQNFRIAQFGPKHLKNGHRMAGRINAFQDDLMRR